MLSLAPNLDMHHKYAPLVLSVGLEEGNINIVSKIFEYLFLIFPASNFGIQELVRINNGKRRKH